MNKYAKAKLYWTDELMGLIAEYRLNVTEMGNEDAYCGNLLENIRDLATYICDLTDFELGLRKEPPEYGVWNDMHGWRFLTEEELKKVRSEDLEYVELNGDWLYSNELDAYLPINRGNEMDDVDGEWFFGEM